MDTVVGFAEGHSQATREAMTALRTAKGDLVADDGREHRKRECQNEPNFERMPRRARAPPPQPGHEPTCQASEGPGQPA
jgi:hypothetical protein